MRKTLQLSMLLCIMMVAHIQHTPAQSYVLEAGESYFSTISSKEYALSGEPGYLTFDAKCVSIWGFWGGELKVAQFIDGSWGDALFSQLPLKDSYSSYGPIQLDKRATKIKLYTEFGATGYKYFTNIKVTRASYVETEQSSLIFNTEVEVPLTQTIVVNHSNVPQLSVTSSDPILFTPNITTITESGEGKFGAQTITINYHSKEATTHSATLTISNGTNHVEVPMSGTAVKKIQSILWNLPSTVVSVGTTLEAIARSTSDLPVEYTSSNPGVVVVKEGKLEALSPGTVTITATQQGTNVWESVSDTREITVTEKQVQHITWTQNLYRLKLGDQPIELNAVASSQLPIVYSSKDENVVTIAGNILTVVGMGTTSVVAYQEGNNEWTPAWYELAVGVRQRSDECDVFVLHDTTTRALHTIESGPELPLSGPAYQLYVDAKRDFAAFGYFYVQEKVNGNWSDIGNPTLSTEWETHGPFNVTRNATHVRCVTKTGATLGKNYRNLLVTQAAYLEADKDSIEIESMVGAKSVDSITINYSNLPSEITVSSRQKMVTLLDATEFGNGCGDFGSKTLSFTVMPSEVGLIKDTIDIVAAKVSLQIPLTITSHKVDQIIIWNQQLEHLTMLDTVSLTATTSASLPVAYISSNEQIATVVEGRLIPRSAGEVTITAIQSGDGTYNAAQPMVKAITITKVAAEITTPPTASTIDSGQRLSASVLRGGIATVEGTFTWEDGTVVPAPSDTHFFRVLFTPKEPHIYLGATCEVNVIVRDIGSKAIINLAPTASAIMYGESLANSKLTGGAVQFDLAGSFAWLDGSITPEAGENQLFEAIFTPFRPDIEGAVCQVALRVNKAPQSITWETDLTALRVGDTVALNAVSSVGLPIHYETSETFIVIEADKLIAKAVGFGSVMATQAGSNNYLAADGVRLFVQVGSTTQLHDTHSVQIRIYPNPTTDWLQVEGEELRHVYVVDMFGRLVQSLPITENAITLSTSALPQGTYLLWIENMQGVRTVERFIKQ